MQEQQKEEEKAVNDTEQNRICFAGIPIFPIKLGVVVVLVVIIAIILIVIGIVKVILLMQRWRRRRELGGIVEAENKKGSMPFTSLQHQVQSTLQNANRKSAGARHYAVMRN